jgi:hypothetical protein
LVYAETNFPVNIESAIYFFDDDNNTGAQSNYRYYVPSSGGNYGVGTADATSIIPVCQAFFVKANVNNVSFDLKNEHRVLEEQAFYKTTNQNKIIRLSINNESATDELIFRVVDNSTEGFDCLYDARKLFPNDETSPQIFSTNLSESPNMAINSIPYTHEKIKLPIGINAPEGNYTISTLEISTDENVNVYLYDSYVKAIINLKETQNYHFYYDGGINVERFEIFFETQEVLSYQNNNTANVLVYPNPVSENLNIELNFKPQNTYAEIIDITGKIVKIQQLNAIHNKINLIDIEKGIYLLKIKSENRYEVIKKIIIQ